MLLYKYSKKHLKVRKADALKQVDANVKEEENKNCSSLYYSNSNSDTATRKTRIKASQLRKVSEEEELAKTKKEKREKEKNKVVAIDSANSILCDLSDLLVVRFCIFSNSTLENIGILTNKKVVEIQTNTATALANKLAAVNKLVRLQTFILKILEHANMPTVHSKAIKHYLALLAAQFTLVCSFKKIDKYIFRANNTISRQTVFNKFYNCKLESIIIAKFYKDL
ncbi:hypothetical protein HBH98_254790 [Parastagonospora nodorum]|nr:hypothetical protein HBH98_254790 [Parastagonospora nodorum]KAH4354266.1 hypothetical protein HBH97_253040 [Parastagonospora nodorum]KAH4366680.1 hypothetical protein HBH99_254280 [Parastagonospora nodorum]